MNKLIESQFEKLGLIPKRKVHRVMGVTVGEPTYVFIMRTFIISMFDQSGFALLQTGQKALVMSDMEEICAAIEVLAPAEIEAQDLVRVNALQVREAWMPRVFASLTGLSQRQSQSQHRASHAQPQQDTRQSFADKMEELETLLRDES